MTVIPVKPALLIWAREHRGLTLQAAAEKLSVDVNELAEMERGDRPVNLTFFKKLSARFKLPGGALLRQTPPAVPPMPADFRTLEGRPPTLGFDLRLAVSYAHTIANNVLELVESNAAPATPILPRLHLEQNAEEAGEAERQRLNVSAITQLGWRTNDGFRNWRSLIEEAGPFVLLKKFSLEDCRGFTVFEDQNAPIIVVNKSEEFGPARTFTVVHEYAHILLRQPGISDQNDRNPVEAFCNRFASAFLMPRGVLRELLPQWPNSPIEWPIDDIKNWATKLKVSQQALALRLEALGVAPPGFYLRVRGQQHRAARRPQDGGDYINTQVNELGDRFTRSVLLAETQNEIRAVEAADILDIAPRHFERVRRQINNQDQRVGIG